MNSIFFYFIVLSNFLITTRLLYGLPSFTYKLVELGIAVFFLFLIALYSTNKKLPKYIFNYIFLVLFTSVVSSFSSFINFDQPLVYGLLSKRDVLILSIPVFTYIYCRDKSCFSIFNYSFFSLCKFYTLFILLSSLMISASSIVDQYGINNEYVSFFIDYSASLAKYRFKFPFLPIVLLVLYLLFGHKKRSYSDIFYLMSGLYWLIFLDGGRSLLVALIVTSVFVMLYNSTITKKFVLATTMILISFLALFNYQQILNSDRFTALNSAASVIYNPSTNTHSVEDTSVRSRLEQYSLIQHNFDLPTFIFGVGNLSENWNNGFEGNLGLRFHPSDLGVVGAVYVYGFLITSIFFTFYFNFLINVTRPYDPFLFSMILFVVLFSIPTGFLVFNTSLFLLFFILRKGSYLNYRSKLEG